MIERGFIEKLKNKYNYIDFSNNEILEIINDIEFSKSVNDKELEKSILKEILVLIKNKLQNNDVSIINNIINEKLSNESSEKEQIKIVIDFTNFYQMLGLDLDIDISSLIVKDSIYLQKSLDKIINLKQGISASNSNLLNLADAYCITNSIELNDWDDDNELLTKEEERSLIIEYRSGSVDAYNTLIEKNLGLVLKITGKYQNRGVSKDDLFQEGCIGLMRAIDKFDIDREVKLSTYAVPWIRQAAIKYIYNFGKPIRVPIPSYEKFSKYTAAEKQLEEKMNRKPTIEELAKHLRWTQKSTKRIATLPLNVDSLDKQINNDEDSTTLGSLLKSENVDVENISISNILQKEVLLLLDKAELTEKQKCVLINYYGLNGQIPLTFPEIAKEYGFSKQGARDFALKALKRLRSYSGIKNYSEYMDNPEESRKNIDLFREESYTKGKKR